MQQVLVQKGNIILEEVPAPAISENELLVKTHYSLISTGTELAGLAISQESLLTRALKQPHNVKKALTMASEKGIVKTYKIIKGLLDFGTPSGYSLAGEVMEVGKNIFDIKVGDLVACSGAGKANHAQFVAVPRLLVSKIPQNLDLRQAASVTIGAIAMQGIRQADPKLGETVAIIGLGLIGQLTYQILKQTGCRVIGIDINEERTKLARSLGIDWVFSQANSAEVKKITDGFGVDTTIITASTESNEPLQQAMEMTRKKGKVIVVGAIGLNLQRSPWYEKEIDLKISCSYGPGRYDATYEEEMLDYPLPYVRWTENRNMEEYLKLLAEKRVNFLALEPQEYQFSEAALAYEYLRSKRPLAMLLQYDIKPHNIEKTKKVFLTTKKIEKNGRIGIALIGAGAFSSTTHLPNLEKLHHLYNLKAIVSKKGTTAKQFAKCYEAEYCTTDYEEILKDPEVDAVLIATRHNLHAKLTLAALKAGKTVFVEKPLAMNEKELEELKQFFVQEKNPPVLMVGFNRRFSPYATAIKKQISARFNPLLIHYRVNAGYLPLDHWTQRAQGGGRVIGEACHFFDLFQFWTEGNPKKIEAQSIHPSSKDTIAQDNFFATITYNDGSVGNLLYTGLGHKDLSKEYVEIYCDGKVLILDDYRSLIVKGGSGNFKTITQDKGHFTELEVFSQAVREGKFPIPLESLFETTTVSFSVNNLVTH